MLCERMKMGNTRVLLVWLLQQPAEIEIGTYRWQTSVVELLEGRWASWSINGGISVQSSLDYATLNRAVISLGRCLAYHRLPYGVWKSSEAGRGGAPGPGRKGGYHYIKDCVPFCVGLVDRRRPLRRPKRG